MEILRHVKWAITPALPVGYADDGGIDFCHREVTGDITQHGRIGVRLNGDWLEVKQLAGEALPADLAKTGGR
jgi:hypothetical protein